MKKILLSSLIAAAAAVPAFAGVDNINYQAVIKNGSAVVANEKVELKFELLDQEKVVYSEEQAPTTNGAGFVSCQLGKEGDLNSIEWGDLTLRVSINFGSGYQVISNEAVSSVPTALYALKSADSEEIKAAVEELMIDNESNKTAILGINAELVKVEGFIEDVETFNTDLVEKIEPMMGLNYEEINDFHERVSNQLIVINDFNESVEGNLQDINDELRKLQGLDAEAINDFHERVSNELIVLNDFKESVEINLQDINDELRKLQGLDAEEIGDFNQRVSDEVARLSTELEQLNTNVDAFATMNETRLDKMQKQMDEADKAMEENYDDLKGSIVRNEQNISVLQGKLNEDIDGLTEQIDAFATMVETRFDKIQGQADAADKAIEELNTNTDAFATMVETRFDKVQGQVDLLYPEVEELIDDNAKTKEQLLSMGAEIGQINGLAEKVELLENTLYTLTSPDGEGSLNEMFGMFGEQMQEMMQEMIAPLQTQIAELKAEIEALKK